MTTVAHWIEGARPRTLPAAVAPVLAGSGTALNMGAFQPVLAVLCLVVSLALQVGVNYANDYSDGIRGTDADRVGPLRLVGSGVATPAAVKRAAFFAFGVAGVVGLLLVVLTGYWWLLGLGAAAILAAWYYTGGRRPYGYLGLGEVFVFVFFGLVAVCGTTYVQRGRLDPATVAAAVTIGCLATAILVANNLRDIDGDVAAGKQTLATRLGDPRTRLLYLTLLATAGVGVALVAVMSTPLALAGFAMLLSTSRAARAVRAGARGLDLIPVLGATGRGELLCAVGLFVGLLLGAWLR